jgi:hypothetical protein
MLGLAGALVALVGAAAAQEGAAGAARLSDRFEMKDQLTIVLPEGWAVYDQTAAVTGRPGLFGLVYFSAESILAPGEKVITLDNSETFFRVDRGDVPAFFVDRHPAEKGMSCLRLTKRAISQIKRIVGSEPLLSRRPTATLIELAGCQGLQLEGRGMGRRVDVRAVSDGKTLYLFSLRNTADNFARNLGAFEAALATLRLSSGPAGASGAPAVPALASFDGRAWRQGYTASTPLMEITEYVLPGEVVEAWTELVTVQRMPGAGDRMGPLEAMTGVRIETLKHCPSTTWTVLRQQEDEALYQWGHRGCRKFGDVFEVAKLYRDGSTITRVAWATKNLPVAEETRTLWIKIIGEYH